MEQDTVMSIRVLPQQSQVLVVDIQEKLAPHLHNEQVMVGRAAQVLEAAKLFSIPFTVAEQYPKGLGKTVEAIAAYIREPVFEKTTFSCFGSKALCARVEELANAQRNTLIVIGCEAHVCVLQSVIDALDLGYNVVVVDDAVGSRYPRDKELAQARLGHAGAQYLSTEMLLFEWTQGKQNEHFKAISSLIK